MNGEMISTAVVPVAGLATRMQPLARAMPKEMLPIGDRPLLHYVVEELAAAGIRHIVFVINSRCETVARYFHHLPDFDRDRSAWESDKLWSKISSCTFSFVYQDHPDGILDAIMRAYPLVYHMPFLVHMGDSMIFRDKGIARRMTECHAGTGADFTIAVSWRTPHRTFTKVFAEPAERIEHPDQPFRVRRFSDVPRPGREAPYVIGRYVLSAPTRMPGTPGASGEASGRFGRLSPLIRNGDSASVMAVPLVGDEEMLGAGTTGEYLASWQRWLECET